MRRIGERDASPNHLVVDGMDLADSPEDAADFPERAAVAADEDFSDEPLFADEEGPVRIDVPGRPGEWIEVKHVPDGVGKGMARFARNQQRMQGTGANRQLAGVVETVLDLVALSRYKRQHCITGYRLENRATGKVVEYSPAHNEQVYARWTGRFGKWVDAQIDRVNGWDDEGAARTETFPD